MEPNPEPVCNSLHDGWVDGFEHHRLDRQGAVPKERGSSAERYADDPDTLA